MTRRPERERAALRARAIGFMAQSRNLFAHLTVVENIRLQLGLSGRPIDPRHAEKLLRSVGLWPRRDARPGALSGGEAARASLAVALANDPPLLIADEPTAEIDRETETHILDVLEERRTRGGASLIATHSAALAARATRVATISDGRIGEATGPHSVARDEPPPRSPDRSGGASLVEARGLARSYYGWRAACRRPLAGQFHNSGRTAHRACGPLRQREVHFAQSSCWT